MKYNPICSKILIKKFLKREYLINKKSTRQIAKEIRCSHTMILYYLKKYNIKRRNHKGINNPLFVDGRTLKQYYCIDCGTEIEIGSGLYGQGRCHNCAVKIVGQSKEFKEKISIISKNNWKNKEYRDKVIKRSMESRLITPNKPEKLLNKLLSKTYKFVGNGKLIVGGFCPDFVNKDNTKIIELFGDYWHNKPEVIKRDKRRSIAYKKYGYKTLIIWEYELKNLDKVENKIKEFNNA